MLDRWLPRPQEVSMNGSDPVTEFAQVLENAGLVLKELRPWTVKSTGSDHR
ncbi:sogS domain protein (plasmid) [Escherichia coli]|nr:sogS domain protein [Escherichia coli]